MSDFPRAVSLENIRAAYPFLRERVKHSPLIESVGVSKRVNLGASGASLRFKMENQQRTGSFKIRGATWKIASLTEAEKARGVVSASAGNHGQGVALAARDAGVQATIFVPRTASIAKIAAMEGYGATVRMDGAEFGDADAAARRFVEETGTLFVSAYDDDAIITGQGSLGLELLEDAPDIDTLLLPIGGGGLFSGVATALKETNPKIRITGVQAEGADGAARSFAAGRLVPRLEPVDTMADGIAIKSPSPRTWEYIRHYADDVVTVSDSFIAEAILLLLSRTKNLVEPSGAASLAALFSQPQLAQGKTVCLLCGGNLDLRLLSDLIERGLIRTHRYFHFVSACSDKPGGLAALLTEVAEGGGNVIEVSHNRLSASVPYRRTGVDLLVEVRDEKHIADLTSRLQDRGYLVDRLS
jgi:threonine dehydratase